MSEPVSALSGRAAQGGVTVRDMGLQGMVTLRGDLADPGLGAVVAEVTGAALPGVRGITLSERGAVAWMSPDELLLLVPHDQARQAVARIGAALAGSHHLAVDVSDARALIAVEGPHAREVMARVTPADLHPASLGAGEIRRSRVGQVAGAFWCEDDATFRVICFRSVADYVFGLLAESARGGAIGLY
ncbi:MAG: sarcosine oxidase subunit gamma [Rubellimicrobium sp.]|nr:sarcosine oxidase subunit gamma [Rubellimicrobium sp.]